MNAYLQWHIPNAQDFIGRKAYELRPCRHEFDRQHYSRMAFQNAVRITHVRIEQVDDRVLITGGDKIRLFIVVKRVHTSINHIQMRTFI